jgi:hypothetical protein
MLATSLCNDKAVLGPWVNSIKTNVLTSIIIGALILMSIILTGSVLFPNLSSSDLGRVMVVGLGVGLIIGGFVAVQSRLSQGGDGSPSQPESSEEPENPMRRSNWQMPRLSLLGSPVMSTQRKVGMLMLRGYLIFAFALVIVKVVDVALAR